MFYRGPLRGFYFLERVSRMILCFIEDLWGDSMFHKSLLRASTFHERIKEVSMFLSGGSWRLLFLFLLVCLFHRRPSRVSMLLRASMNRRRTLKAFTYRRLFYVFSKNFKIFNVLLYFKCSFENTGPLKPFNFTGGLLIVFIEKNRSIKALY